nr:hypothetical protein [Clostridia bacterium]
MYGSVFYGEAMNSNQDLNFRIKRLSEKFFSTYNPSDYPEIESKINRPYFVYLVKIGENNFAIPFRTNIRHNNCYKFLKTSRRTQSSTGLDFSKAVIVNDNSYIGEDARIDDDEYSEILSRDWMIVKNFIKYLEGYCEYVRNSGKEYECRKYQFTSLKYFHRELGLEK